MFDDGAESYVRQPAAKVIKRVYEQLAKSKVLEAEAWAKDIKKFRETRIKKPGEWWKFWKWLTITDEEIKQEIISNDRISDAWRATWNDNKYYKLKLLALSVPADECMYLSMSDSMLLQRRFEW